MSGTALVLGGSKSVWKEIRRAKALGEYEGVIAANYIGMTWPEPLDAWVSQHPNEFDRMIPEREANGHPPAARVFGSLHKDRRPETAVVELIEHRFPGQVQTGSSGLFAVKVALADMGFERVVLCGVPLTQEGGHFAEDGPWRGAPSFYTGWREVIPLIRDRVRSLSGWTRETFGAPTPNWIRSGDLG